MPNFSSSFHKGAQSRENYSQQEKRMVESLSLVLELIAHGGFCHTWTQFKRWNVFQKKKELEKRLCKTIPKILKYRK